MEKAIQDGIYNPELYNISFVWKHPQCDRSLAIGFAAQMVKQQKIDCILGPTCIQDIEIVGSLANFKNIPIFPWTTSGPDFRDKVKYPTAMSAAGSINGLVSSTSNVIRHYNWTQLAFLYTDIENDYAENVPFCKHYSIAFKTSTALTNVSIYFRFANNNSVSGFQSILTSMKSRSRIIILCLESREDRRNFIKAANLNNMINADYVYLFIRASSQKFGTLLNA